VLDAAIGIRSTPAQLALHSPPAQFSVQQRPAALSVERQAQPISISYQQPRISVDSTVPRQEEGYFQPVAYAGHNWQETAHISEENIAHIVQTGEAYRDSGERGHGVPRDQAGPPAADWNIAFIPRTPPEVRITPGNASIDIGYAPPRIQFQPQPPIVEVQAQPVRFAYTPGTLDIYLRPTVDALGGRLDTTA
jgi:hypothetical protein